MATAGALFVDAGLEAERSEVDDKGPAAPAARIRAAYEAFLVAAFVAVAFAASA